MAAPRICPSCSTSSRASAAARSPVAASARSGERTTLAARVPAQRADCPATSPPSRAERDRRELGGWRGSSGMSPGYGARPAAGTTQSRPAMERATAIGFYGSSTARRASLLRRRPADPLRELLAPDVEWHVPGASPIAGDHVGVDAVLDYMTRRRDRPRRRFACTRATSSPATATISPRSPTARRRSPAVRARGRRSGSTASARTGSRRAGCSRSTRLEFDAIWSAGRVIRDLRPRPRQPDRRAHGLQRRARAAVRDRPRRHRRGRAARRATRSTPRRSTSASATPSRCTTRPGPRAGAPSCAAPPPSCAALGVPLRAARADASPATSRAARACRPRPRSRPPCAWRCWPWPGAASPTARSSPSSARASRTTGWAPRPACSTSSPACAASPTTRCGSTSPTLDARAGAARPRRLAARDGRLGRRALPRRRRLQRAPRRVPRRLRRARHRAPQPGRRRTPPRPCPSRWRRRARHVLSENARVDATVAALRAGDLRRSAGCWTPRTPACATTTRPACPRSSTRSRAARPPARRARAWSAAASAARCWPCSPRARSCPRDATPVAPGPPARLL